MSQVHTCRAAVVMVFVGTLLLSVCIEASSVPTTATPAPPATPPPLPWSWWTAWTTFTETWINSKGNSTEQYSYGFHTVWNDNNNGTVCRWDIDLLFPNIPTFTSVIVSNYTSGVEQSRDMNYNGSVTDCASKAINGTMPFGGAWFLAPGTGILAQMAISTYAMAGGENCSVWEWVGPDAEGNKQVLQWFTAVAWPHTPQLLVNQTFYTTPFSGDYVSRIVTTAYVGQEQIWSWPAACSSPNICGSEFCSAIPNANAAAVQSALSWVCGGYVDCNNISQGGPNYYPNTLTVHASWAFNQYYFQNVQQGPTACDFNGVAELVICSDACTLCHASDTANLTTVATALAWVCAHGNIDCTAIQPGGDHFYPNTTLNHANYAFNEYYQGYKCVSPQSAACDFDGTGVVVPCQE